MTIKRKIYEFTRNLVDAAIFSAKISGSQIQVSRWQEYKPGKTIRIGNTLNSTLADTGNSVPRKDNADLFIFFVVVPETQDTDDLIEAEELAEEMADEWFLAMTKENVFSGPICNIGRVFQSNDWIRPGTVRMPCSILRLNVNPRG